jgi:hypothetical protein
MKGSFRWRNILRLLDAYKGIAKVNFGSGDTILLWHDLWNGQVLKLTYPQLYSFAKADMISLKSILVLDNIQNHFHLPLSEEVYEQFCDLNVLLLSLQDEGQNDIWSYMWGNKEYSVQRAYLQLSRSSYVHPAFNWIWKSKCQAKQKVFFWLLLHDRLNMCWLLQRKNMVLDSYTCELCLHQRMKSLRHLFMRCLFAKNCWSAVGALVPTWLRDDRATSYLRKAINKPFAMGIIIVMCWSGEKCLVIQQ